MNANAAFVLSTGRLQLRQVRRTDVQLLDQLNREPQVLQYLARNPPPVDEVRALVERSVQESTQWPQLGLGIAELAATGEFVGWLELRPYAGDQRAAISSSADLLSVLEVGYRLRPGVWGRGLATEGCRALVDYAFALPGTCTIVATSMFTNRRSRRVMEKCGLVHVKTFHILFDDPLPGTELGEVLYAISRESWEARHAAES